VIHLAKLTYQPDELEELVQEYFEKKQEEEGKLKYMSIYDICAFLNISYETWRRWEHRPEFVGPIKRAKTRIFNNWIQQLFYPGRNSTGAIFYLKNALGWSDRQEITQQINHTIEQGKDLDKLTSGQIDKLEAALEALEEKENTITIEETDQPESGSD